MSSNRLIENAPIYIPLLVAAALVLVTWYRPAPRSLDNTFPVPDVTQRSPDAGSGKK